MEDPNTRENSISGTFRPEELAAALRRLKPGKSPGLDVIFPEFILHAGSDLKSWFCDFLTSCMRQLNLSKAWRRAPVVAIPKLEKQLGDPWVIALYLFCLPPSRRYGIVASPASCCDCYLTDTWSAWLWGWLAIAASPLPQITANEAGYDATPRNRRPTGIRPGTPSLQHLHHWSANHRIQEVCICWRSSNHACWWRLAGIGRGAEQGNGNRRWIPPHLEAKAQHYKDGVGNLYHNNKETKREVKVTLNSKTLPFCSEPKCLRVALDRSLTYRRNLESLRNKLTSRVALLRRLAGSGWGAGATTLSNSHPSPGAFNRRVLRACLVPQCSYPPHRPHNQRCLANCDWMPASYTSGQPSNSCRHPTCCAFLSMPCHGAWTPALLSAHLSTGCECTAFVLAAHPPIGSSNNNNIHAAHWADHQWKVEWLDNLTRFRTFIPDTGTHPHGMSHPRTAWVWAFLNRLHTGVARFRSCACSNGVRPPLRPVSMAHKNKESTTLSSESNTSTSSQTARPNGSGRWDNRVAAKNLPRDLMRPNSGLKELAQTTTKKKQIPTKKTINVQLDG